MDHCASVLLAFPSDTVAADPGSNQQYDAAIKQHLARVHKLFKEHSADVAASADLLLNHLDPAKHSLSYLAVLEHILTSNTPSTALLDASALSDRIVAFFTKFDARQIRYVGSLFRNIFSIVGGGHVISVATAVPALAEALLRLDPTGTMMTSNHLVLAKLAYNSNNILPAIPVVSRNIVFYPGAPRHSEHRRLCDPALLPTSYITKDSGLTTSLRASEVLEYDFIAGLMHCSQKDWASANAAFERAITFPTRDGGVSKIMAESHKRWVLTALLRSGKSPEQPTLVSVSAARSFSTLSKSYIQLAELFEGFNTEVLRVMATEHLPMFEQDNTVGLVREVLASYQRWQVYFLRDTYTKISLTEIRAQTRSAETGEPLPSDDAVEALARDMITSGMLQAHIHPAAGSRPAHLEYLPDEAAQLSEAAYAQALAASAQRLERLRSIVAAVDERLVMGKDYARYQLKEQQRREKNGDGKGGAAAGGFDEQIEDEDLFAGTMAAR